VAAIALAHLIFLHQKGSTNPIGRNPNQDKVTFHPYFATKDFIPMIIVITSLILLVGKSPNLLGDPENFSPANPITTPVHIQPE